jgi:hypothetical protein
LDWNSYKKLRELNPATTDDFIALVLQERLIWHLEPFRLRRAPAL